MTEAVATRTFERLLGGIDITPVQEVSLVVLGAHDVGNADAPVIEGDFSSWLFLHSRHPIDSSFTSTHFYEDGITSSLTDLRTNCTLPVSGSSPLEGAERSGAEGPKESQTASRGPDLAIFLREWDTRIDVQSGYGSSHLYGLVGFSKPLGWDD